MTSLRSSKGLNKKRILDQWGQDKLSTIEKGIGISIKAGNVVEEDEAWRLTARGKFLADGIAASLFFLNK
jgi:oxygen-independent coproporphyrinogen-3 oxidase